MGADAVTHTVKSVRHHHIELSLPGIPKDDEEAFVITSPGMRTLGELRLRPQDFQQLVCCLVSSRDQIIGGGA